MKQDEKDYDPIAPWEGDTAMPLSAFLRKHHYYDCHMKVSHVLCQHIPLLQIEFQLPTMDRHLMQINLSDYIRTQLKEVFGKHKLLTLRNNLISPPSELRAAVHLKVKTYNKPDQTVELIYDFCTVTCNYYQSTCGAIEEFLNQLLFHWNKLSAMQY